MRIPAEQFHIAVNVVLGLVCLVSIFLAGKYVSDKGTRKLLIAALVLMIVSGAALSFCQHIFRLSSLAYMGDQFGVTDGAVEKISMFGYAAAAANIFEVAAIALCALVGKKLISLRAGAQSEGGVEQ